MSTQRRELADTLLQQLRHALPSAKVMLRGSLAMGAADEFSDIDIGLRIVDLNDRTALLLKLWIVTAKHHARNRVEVIGEIERLQQKLDVRLDEADAPAVRLRACLDVIKRLTPPAFAGLVTRCEHALAHFNQDRG